MPETASGDFAEFPPADCGVPSMPCGKKWARLEYLLWWRSGQNLPPLATTSPDDTPIETAGVLGLDTTTVLLGGETVGTDIRPGGRVTLGVWLDFAGCHAIEGRFFSLGNSLISYTAESDGSPILARPFLDDTTPASQPLAYEDFTTNGNLIVHGESDVLGGDVLYRWLAGHVGSTRLDFTAGYQFARVGEKLTIASTTEAVNIPSPPIDPGTVFEVTDQFETSNEFSGGSVGLVLEHQGPWWTLELLAKVGLGNMHETVTIGGRTVATTPPPDPTTNTENFGLLAQGANLGVHSRNQFTVAPEFGATFVFQLGECTNLTAGYSLVYWNHVAQAADQIDPTLQVPTTEFAIRDSVFWTHGFNVGAELRF